MLIAACLGGLVLSSSVSATSARQPEPVAFLTNDFGQTYGSIAGVPAHLEPDLIAAVGTNGSEGYVLKNELDLASGGNVGTPAEALVFMEQARDTVIPLYEVDGRTQIGVFEIQRTIGTDH